MKTSIDTKIQALVVTLCGGALALAALTHHVDVEPPTKARANVAAPLAPEPEPAPTPEPLPVPVDAPEPPVEPAPALLREEPALELVDGCVVAGLDELVVAAERVVLARVSGVRAAWDEERSAIYTHVTLEVSEILKGAVGTGPTVIRVLGGALPDEDVRLEVSHQPVLVPGDRAIFFIDDDEGLRTQLVGAVQGVLRLVEDERGIVRLQDGFGRTVVRVRDDGRLETATAPGVAPAGVVREALARTRSLGRG